MRKEAIAALIRIASLEGAVLVAVVAAYFFTGSLQVLVIGLIASVAAFAPLFLRWTREHGAALKAKPNSVEEAQEDR